MADYTLSELQSALGSAKQANDAISVQTIQNAIANGDYKQPQMPKQVVKPDVGATAKDLPFYQSRPDLPMPYNLLPKQQSHTAGQVATGIGEAASGLITGMTTGGAGYLGGLLRGIGNSVAEGTFGSRAGAIDASNLAEASARRLTYEPKTELGNRYLSKAVGFLEPLNALGGVAGDLGAISDLASAAKPALVNDFLHPTAPVLESTSNITRGTEPASASVIRDMLMEHKVEAEALLKEQTTPEGIANVTADLNNTNAKLAEIEAQTKQAVPQEEPTIAQALNKPADEGDMIKLLMDASSGNKSAQAKIAQEAKINPEIVNAAERLGIDLPSDLFSENTTLKQGAGATRSVVGEPSAAWRDTVRHATEEADNAIAQLGGANDIASMSEQVKDSLNTTRGTLKNQASELYTAVDNAIPKNTEVTTDKLKTTLAEISQEVGGELSPVEKQLIDKINGDTPITYGGLLRLKGQIGDALSSKISQSPFGSVDTSSLKRIYNAIKDDQLSNVEALAGTDTRDMLFQANRLTQKQKALEERMIGAFGSEGEGSIATLMTRALSQGSKGDITALNKLMKTVPEELKKDTIATALVNMSKSKRGIDAGSFDFNGFTKLYQGIRQNKPVYDTVISALGKDKEQLLMDLYQVSKSIVEAEKNVSTTGASNQLFMRALEHISLREKVVKKVLGKTLDTATLGIVPASELIGHLFKTTPEKAKAIGELLRSQEFKDALLKEVKSENQVMGKPKAESSGLLFSASDNTDYRMEHKAPKPDGMNTGDNVRDIWGEDMYNQPKAYSWYGHGENPIMDKKAVDVIKSMKDNPDKEITIYRAVPKNVDTINAGDWVTTVKDYAQQHGSSYLDDFHIISEKVKAKDIATDGNSIFEWGYNPSEPKSRLEEWHKDSAPETKNADGTPKVFYHGTGASFDTFDSGKVGASFDAGKLGHGFYLTDDSSLAESYSRMGRVNSNPNVMPLYVNIKKPFVIDGSDGKLLWTKLDAKSKEVGINEPSYIGNGMQPNHKWSKLFTEKMSQNGYDGVILKFKDGSNEVAVFNPNQIKSVNNRGTFDETNPNILYSLEGKKTTSTTPEQVLSQVKSSLGNNYSKFENDIVIVPNKEALPKDHHHFQIDAFEYARQDKSVGVQGFYDEKDNKVYIIANRTMPKEIDGIINHELFHRHLQQELVGVMNKEGVGKAQALLGSKYQSIVDRMNELAKTDPLVKKAKDKSLTYKDNQDEEMMAYLIQYHSGLKGTAREFVVQLISALRQAVAKSALKLGFKPNKVLGYMNSKDIANLLRRETTQGKNIPISE